jgi:hypothetical protein
MAVTTFQDFDLADADRAWDGDAVDFAGAQVGVRKSELAAS